MKGKRDIEETNKFKDHFISFQCQNIASFQNYKKLLMETVTANPIKIQSIEIHF